MRPLSAQGCSLTQLFTFSRSLTASMRFFRLSAFSYPLPKPVEPRTLGSTTAKPREIQKLFMGDQPMEADAAGPPWMATITGSLALRGSLAGR